MSRFRVDISAPFILFAALLFFFDGTGLVSAAIPAIIVHELGHAAAIGLCGCRVTRLDMRLLGFSLDYWGELSRGGEVFAALAGPAAGLAFAMLTFVAGRELESRFLLCSADISLLYSLFNLLPALPLDGGRALSCIAGETAAKCCACAVSCALLFAGLFLLSRGYGIALLVAGGYLACPLVSEWISG